MAADTYRGLRRAMAVAVCLACAVWLSGASATGAAVPRPLRLLQMNLCDSGLAACYTGRSVAQAEAVIRADAPDVVTLNEVCRDDVAVLRRALARVRGGRVVWAFRAVRDRRTADAYRCRNGQPYGIGLLALDPAPSGAYRTSTGLYPMQADDDPEQRAWLCVDLTVFSACTTHLAATSPAVALAQCGYLLEVAVPAERRRDGHEPTVLGADLNLRTGGSPDVRSCVPAGYLRADDGSVQQVLATDGFTIFAVRSAGMRGTTDHPSLLVVLTAVHGSKPPSGATAGRPSR